MEYEKTEDTPGDLILSITQELYSSDISIIIKNLNNKPIIKIVKNRMGNNISYTNGKEFIPFAAWLLAIMRDKKSGIKFFEEATVKDIQEKIEELMRPYMDEKMDVPDIPGGI